MYAIVKTGGKQYRVERGQRLLIERLAVEEGANVTLEPILYRSEEAVFDRAGLERVKVTAKVLAHVRGEKLRVFKFKPKRGYKRRTGHRQDLTQIEVTEIVLAAAGRAAAKPEAAAPPAEKPQASAAAPAAAKPKAAKPKAAKPAAAKAAKPKAAKPAAPKAAKPKPAKPAAKPKAADGAEEEGETDGS
jgi:large subunit ribosomal protein L21